MYACIDIALYSIMSLLLFVLYMQRDGRQLYKLSKKQRMVSQNLRCNNREPGLRNNPVVVQQDCCPDSSDALLDGANRSGRHAYSWKELCVKQRGF